MAKGEIDHDEQFLLLSQCTQQKRSHLYQKKGKCYKKFKSEIAGACKVKPAYKNLILGIPGCLTNAIDTQLFENNQEMELQSSR